MRRRTFAQALTAGSTFALAGLAWPVGHWLQQSRRGPPAASGTGTPGIGTNLSGLEWAKPALRRTEGTQPNLNFTVPRKADVAWLAAEGFRKNRLPIQWELLQPMLHDTRANAQVRALVGEPGEFHAGYAQYITDVLDAHAAVGARCIIDLHNYARYQDFAFQGDGSVRGLKSPPSPLQRAFTEDGSQVQERIFALATGATLTQAHFADFWRRAAARWKDHPGFGGYGLMNEPHDLPRPGQTVASEGGGEDLTIWPAYARAAIDAIRAIDRANPIYVAGNEWSSAMAMPTRNPGFPLQGENLVYEVHMYLDSQSSGHWFDFESEKAKNFSAGVGRRPIDMDTGVNRLRPSIEWAREHGLQVALTEVGMPIDDPRWEEMFTRACSYAVSNGCEVMSWMGGSHWPIRNFAINHVPGWYQNKTFEPAVCGPMKAAAGIARATLYDDAAGWAPPGKPVTVTVFARGHLARPLRLTLSSEGGGSFSQGTVTLPAGPNRQASFTFTPPPDRVATIRYAADGGHQVPPPRKVYALTDPVALAGTRLADAAHAILARYQASKWDMADGHTDFVGGQACADGQALRAVSDSGFGSRVGNAMEMLNFVNKDNAQSGTMQVPRMRTVQGRKCSDHTAPDTFGLWCKKTAPEAGVQPNPRNRALFDLHDEHFAIAAISVPGQWNSGIVFQASRAENRQASELRIDGLRAQARWLDAKGQEVVLASPAAIAPGVPHVLSFTAAPGAQTLRVDAAEVARAQARFAPSAFSQMLIGWGFVDYYPRGGFGGHVYAVIAGRGRPSPHELAVLERYLASLSGARAPTLTA
jgi:endoglucanase